jgi:hypothetical protein
MLRDLFIKNFSSKRWEVIFKAFINIRLSLECQVNLITASLELLYKKYKSAFMSKHRGETIFSPVFTLVLKWPLAFIFCWLNKTVLF